MDGLPVRRTTLASWQAASPTRLSPTTWPAAGWLVLFVVVVALVELPVCTAQQPCEPARVRTLLQTALLVAPFWVWWAPWLSRPLGVLLALGWAVELALDPDGLPLAGCGVAVVVLLAWTVVAGQVVGQGVEAGQRLAAAAPQARWPGPLPDPAGRLDGLRTAVVLAVLATAALTTGLRFGAAEAEREAAATRVTGTVVAHEDDDFTLGVDAGGRLLRIDTYAGVQDYPVGSQQVLLQTSSGTRLAAEPYDPTGWFALGLGLIGLAGLVGLRGRRRVTALRRLFTEPQPVLAVRLLPRGSAVVVAVDDHRGLGPALSEVPVGVPYDDNDDDDDESPLTEHDTVAATAYGLPLPGRAVALLTADGDPLLPYALARRPPGGLHGPDDGLPVPDLDEPAGREALVVLTAPPVRVALARLGVVLSLVACVALAAVSGLGGGVVRLLVTLNLGVGCLLTATATTRFDADGVVVQGPLRRRTVAWGGLRSAEAAGGDLVLTTREGHVLPLPWPQSGYGLLPRPARDRRVRAAAAVLQGRIDQAPAASPDVVVEHRSLARAYALAVVVCLVVGLLLRPAA